MLECCCELQILRSLNLNRRKFIKHFVLCSCVPCLCVLCLHNLYYNVRYCHDYEYLFCYSMTQELDNMDPGNAEAYFCNYEVQLADGK